MYKTLTFDCSAILVPQNELDKFKNFKLLIDMCLTYLGENYKGG